MPAESARSSRETLIDRRRFCGSSAGFVSAFWCTGLAAAPAPGLVEALRGEAHAELGGTRRALALRGSVFVEETVVTGQAGRLALRFGRDTRLRLGAAARLKIDRFVADAGGEFSLCEGGLFYDRPRQRQGGENLLRSLFGLIAIRGTQLFAGPSNGVFGVFVARGSVDVSAAGKTITLRSGFGTDIAAPGEPPTDPGRWKRPRIRAALASVS